MIRRFAPVVVGLSSLLLGACTGTVQGARDPLNGLKPAVVKTAPIASASFVKPEVVSPVDEVVTETWKRPRVDQAAMLADVKTSFAADGASMLLHFLGDDVDNTVPYISINGFDNLVDDRAVIQVLNQYGALNLTTHTTPGRYTCADDDSLVELVPRDTDERPATSSNGGSCQIEIFAGDKPGEFGGKIKVRLVDADGVARMTVDSGYFYAELPKG